MSHQFRQFRKEFLLKHAGRPGNDSQGQGVYESTAQAFELRRRPQEG